MNLQQPSITVRNWHHLAFKEDGTEPVLLYLSKRSFGPSLEAPILKQQLEKYGFKFEQQAPYAYVCMNYHQCTYVPEGTSAILLAEIDHNFDMVQYEKIPCQNGKTILQIEIML